ncbi:putative transcription elongation factor 1 [Rosa chinensis]|uniref:Transcription elongation factor 1 homolog n=1 Tax=Rosa chinensis TaxID=74649 RepID=A0A2P6R4G4_ROSCH|nr:putative transcription elongation factor 1 [Rosa chinensis]
MGKRKSRAKPVANKKRVQKLDTVYTCPFCSHGQSVECEIDTKVMEGRVRCFICKESYATKITTLTEAIDIYSEWIDECIRVNQSDS